MSSHEAAVLSPGPYRIPARWLLWGSFAVIYLIWGSSFLGIKVAVETLPPLFTAAVRFLISGGILLLATSRIRPRPTARHWVNAAMVGALFFLVNHGLVSSAARYIPSSLACLIAATQVPIIAVLSSVLLPNQPLTRRSLIGAALGLTGVVCLFVGQGIGADVTSVLPCLAILGAATSWALGAVFSQRLEFPPHPVLRAAMQMICGGVMLSGVSLLRGEPWAIDLTAVSSRSLASLAYLILFASVLAFACYSYLLKHVRTDMVATHVFVNPLVAVALGTWLAGEQLRAAHFASGLLILTSVCLITLGFRGHPRASHRPSARAPVALSPLRNSECRARSGGT